MHTVKKKVAILFSHAAYDDLYPLQRAETIARAIQDDVELLFLVPDELSEKFNAFPKQIANNEAQRFKMLSLFKPHLLLRESDTSTKEELAKLKSFIPTIMHFDDFGEGAQLADIVFQTLYTDIPPLLSTHYLVGAESFVAYPMLKNYQQQRNLHEIRQTLQLVVFISCQDQNNLTYRVLRHLKQLQIPLKVTILVHPDYAHDVIDLRMMALSRGHTTVLQVDDPLPKLAEADMIICSARYTPYTVSMLGIPCIVLAENEAEMAFQFPNEDNGFLHLGLGRKVKQSMLLNAVMELVLHEHLREQAIKKQLAQGLDEGYDKVLETIRYYLEYPKRPVR